MTNALNWGSCRPSFLGMSRVVTLADSYLGNVQRDAGRVDGCPSTEGARSNIVRQRITRHAASALPGFSAS